MSDILFSVIVIASLINLTILGMASGNEPANTDTNNTALTTVDPAQLFRSDLSFIEKEKIEAQLVENIQHMLEQIHSKYPSQAQRPSVLITGFTDSAVAESQSRTLASFLWRRDVNKLFYFMRRNIIAPVYEQHDNGALVFESKLDESISARLLNAIEDSDYPKLDKILLNDQLDLEVYLQGATTSTPLVLAVTLNNAKAVQRLLEAGANPDNRDRGGVVSPLFVALQNGNEAIIRMLGEAGADLDKGIGVGRQIMLSTANIDPGKLDKLNKPGLRMSPIAWSISNGRTDLATLLIELGADPDIGDYAGWTALMDALFNEQIDAIEALIPVSDPRIISEDDITRDHDHKNVGLRFLPRGNALFLALRMRSKRTPAIANALRDRASELDADAGLKLIELSAQRSTSRLAWFEGRQQESIDAHRKAIKLADVPSITALTNGAVTTQAMEMLTELHEMLLINGQTLTDQEYADVAHITEIGGWHAPLHDMLDIVAAGLHAYPAEQLNAWFTANGTPSHEDWNFDRLNTWVESITDTRQRDRLFDVLDFFEQIGWRR